MLAEEILRDRCEKCTVDFGFEHLITQAAIAGYNFSTVRHGMMLKAARAVPIQPADGFEG